MLATEGGYLYQNRIVALQQSYPEHINVKLAVRPSPINLYDAEEDIAKVKAIISELTKKHGPVKMLIIDTLARATSGGHGFDENDNSIGTNSNKYTPTSSGSFYVVVTDSSGCTGTSMLISFEITTLEILLFELML